MSELARLQCLPFKPVPGTLHSKSRRILHSLHQEVEKCGLYVRDWNPRWAFLPFGGITTAVADHPLKFCCADLGRPLDGGVAGAGASRCHHSAQPPFFFDGLPPFT